MGICREAAERTPGHNHGGKQDVHQAGGVSVVGIDSDVGHMTVIGSEYLRVRWGMRASRLSWECTRHRYYDREPDLRVVVAWADHQQRDQWGNVGEDTKSYVCDVHTSHDSVLQGYNPP